MTVIMLIIIRMIIMNLVILILLLLRIIGVSALKRALGVVAAVRVARLEVSGISRIRFALSSNLTPCFLNVLFVCSSVVWRFFESRDD